MSVKPYRTQPLYFAQEKLFSQYGEDGVCRYILSQFDHQKFVIDIGADDGVRLSNVRYFVESGYGALLVEGSEIKAKQAAINSREYKSCVVVNEFIQPDKGGLEKLVSAHGYEGIEPALLSIDIDSFDYQVLAGLEHLRPEILVIEFNPTIPNHLVVVETQETSNTGNSALALVELAKSMGYSLVHATFGNLIFLNSSRLEHGFTELSLSDCLNDMHTVKGVWTGFDGKVHFAGSSILDFPWLAIYPDLAKKAPIFSYYLTGFPSHYGKVKRLIWFATKAIYTKKKVKKLLKRLQK